jgi:hypothetical protein
MNEEGLKTPWARNSDGTVVAAWDHVRCIKGVKYFCVCLCGDIVILRSGPVIRAHFAYKAVRRSGCTGGVGFPESKLHYDAKWLLSEIFHKINFWTVCTGDHRISKMQFSESEWSASVEKTIPNTKRIADVLLTHTSGEKFVALEVFNSNAVSDEKKSECKLAGVPIIELRAVAITTECRDIDNIVDKIRWEDCKTCQRLEKQRLEWKKQDEIRWFQEQRDRRELEDFMQKEKRAQEIAAQLQRVTLEKERVERERVRELERVKEERIRQEKRAYEREQEEALRERHSMQTIDRQDKRVIFTTKLERLNNALASAKRSFHMANMIHMRDQHAFTTYQKGQQLQQYNTCKNAVVTCEEELEYHKDSGRSKRSRISWANAGCNACACSAFRCVVHDDRETERWV